MLRVLFFILFIALANPIAAQQYTLRNYTMNDGLSNDNVYRTYQDARGFLWIRRLPRGSHLKCFTALVT